MIKIERYDLDCAMRRAVSAYMNGLAPELPPLSWSLEHGDALDGLADDGDVAAVEQWAAALELPEVLDPESAGTRMFQGPSNIHRITTIRVWVILDRAAWDRETEEQVARIRARALLPGCSEAGTR